MMDEYACKQSHATTKKKKKKKNLLYSYVLISKFATCLFRGVQLFFIDMIKKHIHSLKYRWALRFVFVPYWRPIFIHRDVYHKIEALDPEKLNAFRTVREITGEYYLLYGVTSQPNNAN